MKNQEVVELKAVTQTLPEHEAQLFNYLRITKQPVGYLLNFGHKDTLEWKRYILSELTHAKGSSGPRGSNPRRKGTLISADLRL